MRKLSLLLVVCALVLCAAPFARAQAPNEPAKLNLGADVALKVDFFHFMDSDIGDLNAENGVLVSLEFYKEVFFPNFFLGVEAGWGQSWGSIHVSDFVNEQEVLSKLDTTITYVPIEFNAKYAIPLAPNFALGLGAGISMNYIGGEFEAFGESFSDDDWVFGGQFFAQLDYKCHNWFFGAHVKYKITEDVKFVKDLTGDEVSADNIAVGLNLGFLF